MGKLIKGTHHIALKCVGEEEFIKTIHFYKDVLGLEVVRTWGEGNNSGAMLDTGNSILEIFANGEEHLEQGALRHLALETDDVDACEKAVSAAGYTFHVTPREGMIPSDPAFHFRMAFCIGPVGEEIEFFQVAK